MDNQTFENELLLSRCVQKLCKQPKYYAFLIGAGISVSAGIPLGEGIVRILKQKLSGELQTSMSRKAGEVIFDELGWFQDPQTEYSEAILRTFTSDYDRQSFFCELITGKMPTLAHYYLANIIANGYCNLVLTTNFDDLLEKAFFSLKFDQFNVIAHEEMTEYIYSDEAMVTVVKLHGHYTFPNLANLDEDASKLSRRLRGYFEELLRQYGLIVCGYAGRDKSVMGPLAKAIRKRTMPRGIIWCIRKAGDITSSQYLTVLKKKSHGNAHFLYIDDADSFYHDLHRKLGLSDHCLLSALSSDRYNYQHKKFLERLATGLSLELPEQVVDSEFHYSEIERHDVINIEEDMFFSTRKLRVRNTTSVSCSKLKHLEVGEMKVSHSDLQLKGRILPTGPAMNFAPIGDANMSFCRAFEMHLPHSIPPDSTANVEYTVCWPGEPSTYGQQPHCQSISLIRYRKGVGSLRFTVSVVVPKTMSMARAWVVGVNEAYNEHTILQDCQIQVDGEIYSFSIHIPNPEDHVYIMYYHLEFK